MRRVLLGAVAASAPFFATPLQAQDTPRDLRDMVGARAGQAEGELGRRGYVWVDVKTGDDRKWSTWWNAGTRTCVTIATMDGRYDSIVTSPAPDCRKSSRPSGWTPPPPPTARPLPEPPVGRPVDGDDNLTLICWGEGQKPGVSTRSGYVWNERRHRYEPYSTIDNTMQGFNSTIQVEFWGDGGRIRLAGKLVAPIHSGDRDGWWDLYNVRMGPDRITAQYRMNGLNKPRVDIDRRTGRIAIDGIEHFRGTCDQGDWGGNRNRF